MKTQTAKKIAIITNIIGFGLEALLFANKSEARTENSRAPIQRQQATITQNYAPQTNQVKQVGIHVEGDYTLKITPKKIISPTSEILQKTKKDREITSSSIISNEFFRNSAYLSEAQIKQLLINKNSCLKNTGIEKTIIQAAQEHGVNPIYILARLQQEQRLLTKEKASKNALKYATGYGARDDKTLPSKGPHYQVRKTAEKLNEFANEFDGTNVLKIDYNTRTIKPKTGAQYALVRYTPHTDGLKLAQTLVRQIDKQLRD